MNCCLILGMNEEMNFLTKDQGPGENFLLRFVSLNVMSPQTNFDYYLAIVNGNKLHELETQNSCL